MFKGQDALCQSVGGVIWLDGNFGLAKDRPIIQIRCHKMDAAAMFRITGIQRPLMRM